MTSRKAMFPLILGLIGFSILVPHAQADSFGFHATGTFQFNSSAASGDTGGICLGQCVPWGQIVILDVSFAASVVDYQQNSSCSNGQCETKITGTLAPGEISAEISIYGNSVATYYLNSNSLQGSFTSHYCTGQCRTYRPETELSLDFQGLWDNDWYSTSTIQMVCFEKGGCSDGSGAGTLTTDTPEPPALVLLLSGIPGMFFATRRRLFKRC